MKQLILYLAFVILFLYNKGILFAENERWIYYDRSNTFGYSFISITNDNIGNIWSITYKIHSNNPTEYGIDYFNSIEWKLISKKEYNYFFEDTTKLYDIISDKKGNVFISGIGAIGKYNKQKGWEKVYFNDTLKQYREFQYLALDSSGNVWITSLVKIPTEISKDYIQYKTCAELFKYDGEQLERKIYSDNYQNEYNYGFTSIACSKSNKVWLAYRQVHEKSTGGLIEYDNENIIYHKLESAHTENFGRNPNKIAIEDTYIWIGYMPITWNYRNYTGGLSRYDSENKLWRHFTKENGLPYFAENHISIFDIFIDNENKIWVATGKNIAEINNEKIIVYNPWYESGIDSINPNQPNYQCISQGKNRSIWIGSGNGIFKFENQTSSIDYHYYSNDYSINFVDENIFIRFNVFCNKDINIRLFNLFGLPVETQNKIDSYSEKYLNCNINTSTLSNGLYLLYIRYCNKFIIEKVLIIK